MAKMQERSHFMILLVVLLGVVHFGAVFGEESSAIESESTKSVGDENTETTNFANSKLKKIKKRLETIDGVEIASSYREYLDLALGDLEDRLRKGYTKQKDLKERIEKRNKLTNEIESEIVRRRAYSKLLSEKDKLLRTRLLRNTEMKSALQNLADIAGYKLASVRSAQPISAGDSRQEDSDDDSAADFGVPSDDISDKGNTLNEQPTQSSDSAVGSSQYNMIKDHIKRAILENLSVKERSNKSSSAAQTAETDSDVLKNDSYEGIDNGKMSKNTTYTRYIEMAYSEVENLLNKDKQTLIEIIRKLRANENKLKELEKLKIKVNDSLKRLTDLETRLSVVLRNDLEISEYLKGLGNKIKNNQLNYENNHNKN